MGIQNWSDNIVLVSLEQEPQLSEDLQLAAAIAEDGQNRDIVVDFQQVSMITSSSIAKLLKVRKILNDNDRKLILTSVNPQIFNVFVVTGLDNVFEFVDERFLAIAGLQMAN